MLHCRLHLLGFLCDNLNFFFSPGFLVLLRTVMEGFWVLILSYVIHWVSWHWSSHGRSVRYPLGENLTQCWHISYNILIWQGRSSRCSNSYSTERHVWQIRASVLDLKPVLWQGNGMLIQQCADHSSVVLHVYWAVVLLRLQILQAIWIPGIAFLPSDHSVGPGTIVLIFYCSLH